MKVEFCGQVKRKVTDKISTVFNTKTILSKLSTKKALLQGPSLFFRSIKYVSS